MGTTNFSKQVYEQIAQDLVKEQAEALKHQTLVDEYKKILVEGKKEIIRKLVKGKRLYFDGKLAIVLEVKFDVEDNKLGVTVIAGLYPFKEENLTECYYWTLDMNDAIQPDFFSRSGLRSGIYGGTSSQELMIEEVTRYDYAR